jgi:cytochrome b involved in lipid metabolism
MAKKVSVAEIRQHGIQEDVWIVVNGEVFDMTEYAPEHPGGEESKSTLMPHALCHNKQQSWNC